jgi:hypothetical protein
VLFEAESVGFKAEESVSVVCEGLVAAAGALYKMGKLMSDYRRQGAKKKTYTTVFDGVVVADVELDLVMVNCPD